MNFTNEILLVFSVFLIFGEMLIMLRLFGKSGLYCWTAIATISANIEVFIVINAFGMEMTLGNVLFASTFLATDILSELFGKDKAQKSVYLGIATSISFILLSQLWLQYIPAGSDWGMPYIKGIFSNTPRIMLAGIVVYVVAQLFDVWCYHRIWAYTERISGNRKSYLWLRNNGATMISQLINTVLFTLLAFAGVYSTSTIISIMISSYIIFLVTSIADTPFIYLARRWYNKSPEKFAE